MPSPSVLVLSTDSFASALIGTLLGLSAHPTVFPRVDEPLLDELARLRPGVVLVDTDHPAAHSESLFEGIRDLGARAILFSPRRSRDDIERQAAKRGLASLALPITGPELDALVRAIPGTP